MKNLYLLLTAVILTTFLTACTTTNKTNVEPISDSTGDNYESIIFNPDNYESKTLELDGEEIKVRAYEGIVYVTNPVDTDREIMNIYVPEAYYNGEEINGFTIDTAPIFFPNKVGGYMPASPETLGGGESNDFMGGLMGDGNRPQGKMDTSERSGGLPEGFQMGGGRGEMGGGMGGSSTSLSLYALKDGYIVASAGARGRTASNGKAPAGIVDLKAAVRYLKYNDALIPGDSNKIISNGTSAGGAMSVLLGTTANHPDYDKYLEELGAAPATDDLYAISAYCPITNLDNADKAYEWEFYGVDSYSKISADQLDYNSDRSDTEDSTVSESDSQISKQLKDMFPEYVNSLGLVDNNGNPYTLDENGEGNFKEDIKALIIDSFNEALNEGNDLSEYTWLTIEDGIVTDIDFDNYIANYMNRNKGIPAFDALDLSAGENNLFGSETVDSRHFTEFSTANSKVENAETAPEDVVKIMNPMNYIGDKNATTSTIWRIRHGAKDADTSLAIPFIIVKTLEQKVGATVDYKNPWNQGHGGDYDPEEFMTWINSVTH